MEEELQHDLAEVLGGLDPMELLREDPDLIKVAAEVCDLLGNDDDANLPIPHSVLPNLGEASLSISSLDSRPRSCEHEPIDQGNSEVNICKEESEYVKVSCEVCGRPANGHRNYGVMTCHSCRAFFSRALKDKAHEAFICVNVMNVGHCQINSESWRSCKKCRFEKCLQLGMKTKKKTQSGHQVVPTVASVADHLRKSLTLTHKLSNEDRGFIRMLVLKRHEVKLEQRIKLMMYDLEYYRSRLRQSYHGKAMTLKSFKNFERFTVYSYLQTFSSGEFSLDGLTRQDRNRLFATNFPIVIEFFEAYSAEVLRWKELHNPKAHIEGVLKELDKKQSKPFYDIRAEVSLNGKLKPSLPR